ncbi:MAG: hypothetical protein JSV80_18105 [Acidobacteriota bacterium]|nr:MAG: hypothetical protein JSV80_18105 [Acidobacteriota bacterium]
MSGRRSRLAAAGLSMSVMPIAMAIAAVDSPDAEQSAAASACALDESHWLVASGEVLVEHPAAQPVWRSPLGPIAALACAPQRVIVAVREENTTHLLVLERPGESWIERGSRRVRGVPKELLLAGDQIVLIVARRRTTELVLLDPDPDQRPITRELTEAPSAAAIASDGTALLIASGERIKSYTLPDGRTWRVYPFDEEINTLGTLPGVRWTLVGLGERVVSIDFDDAPGRATMRYRAEAQLSGLVHAAAWTDEGRAAVVLAGAPRRLYLLQGSDLSILDQRLFNESFTTLALLEGEAVVLVDAEGRTVRRELPQRQIARAMAVPSRYAPDSAWQTIAAEVPTERTQGADAPDTREASPVAPVAETVPAPAERPGRAADPPAVMPPAPVRSVDPERRGFPTSEEPKPLQVPPPPPEPRPEKPKEPKRDAPAETAPSLESSPPGKIKPVVPPPRIDLPETPPDASASDVLEIVPPAAIVGRITGQNGLVEQVLIVGPNSILEERARLRPQTDNGTSYFSFGELPEGRYRVMLFGRSGASLSTRPRIAEVSVDASTGARADFEVLGPL